MRELDLVGLQKFYGALYLYVRPILLLQDDCQHLHQFLLPGPHRAQVARWTHILEGFRKEEDLCVIVHEMSY